MSCVTGLWPVVASRETTHTRGPYHPPVPPSPPTCPRCTYDLSGQVTTWADSCPTTGTCSECGLTFDWRLIFNPNLDGLPWFIECPRPPRKRWPWLRTTAHVLVPWKFWKRVTVETPIHTRGVIRWLVCLVALVCALPLLAPSVLYLPGYIVSALTSTGPSTPSYWLQEFPVAIALDMWHRFHESLETLTDYATELRVPMWTLVGAACSTAFPAIFFLLPFTRRASKVRAALVWRAAAYSLAWITPFIAWLLLSLTCQAICDAVPWNARPGPIASFALNTCSWIAEHSPFHWSGWWLFSRPPAYFAVPVAAWIATYWLFAMKRSWRMPDWRAAWLACASVALVLTLFALLTDESLLAHWL